MSRFLKGIKSELKYLQRLRHSHIMALYGFCLNESVMRPCAMCRYFHHPIQ